MKRGQTALEYLITYGWAILAIVIIAALFWAFFKPTEWLGGETATGFSVVTVPGWKVDANGTLTIALSNGAAEDVKVTKVSAGAASPTFSTTIKPGDKASFTVGGTGVTGSVGQPYELNVSVTYDLTKTGITGKVSSGMLRGKLS